MGRQTEHLKYIKKNKENIGFQNYPNVYEIFFFSEIALVVKLSDLNLTLTRNGESSGCNLRWHNYPNLILYTNFRKKYIKATFIVIQKECTYNLNA